MSFVDEDSDQSMFDEFDELHNEAETQRENAASLLTTEVTDSTLHSINAETNNDQITETTPDNLTTTSDLLALHDLLENEEPEEEADPVEVESSTLSLFDRLMKQENSIFVTNDGLLESAAKKGPGGLENKITRNPLIEGDVPPWDNDTPSVVITSEPSTDLDSVHPPVQVYAEDEDDISFDDADDAPFEKTTSASQDGVQQDDAQHDNIVEPKEQIAAATEFSEHTINVPHDTEQIETTEVWQDTLNAEQETEYEPSEVALTHSVEEDFESPPQKQFVDMADEIASMFGHGVNDLSNVKVTHPQIAPYLENGEKLLRAKQINKWSDFIEELGVGGLNKQLLLQSNLVQHGEHFIVRIDERNKHLDEEQHRTTITEALSKFYEKPVAFEVQYGEVDETPFKIQQQISLIRHQHAHSVVQTNDSIQELIKAFEGRIIDGSIKPR